MNFRSFVIVYFSFALASVPARAQDMVFDAEQWGNVNLVVRQSSGGSVEALLTGSGKHEPLRLYDQLDRLWRLSRPVGRLDVRFANRKFITCTATLVTADIILTNNHCVPGANDNLEIHGPVTEASLVMNYFDETRPDLIDTYAVDIQPISTSADRDFSFLRVRTPPGQERPGTKWGTAKVLEEAPRPGESLLIIHHPAGLPKHVTRFQCRAASPTPTDSQQITLFHFCDTLPGSSGAPIFSDEKNAIVAIHRAGATVTGPGATNYGVLITGMRKGAGGEIDLALATPEAGTSTPPPMTKHVSLYSLPEQVHIGDERIVNWSDLTGACHNIRFGLNEDLDGIKVMFEAYGAENTSIIIDGRSQPFIRMRTEPGKKRPNYWSEPQTVTIETLENPRPRIVQICAEPVPNPEKPGDLDDFMVRNVIVEGFYTR